VILVTEGLHVTCKNAHLVLILLTAMEMKLVAIALAEVFATILMALAHASLDFLALAASTRPLFFKLS